MAARQHVARLMSRVQASVLQQRPLQCHLHRHGAAMSTGPASTQKEYAFEMACSNIRYGEGVTQEIGLDCKSLGGRVCVMTDPRLRQMEPVQAVLESLERQGINFQVYDQVEVEPTDKSFMRAISYAREHQFDVYVAVGGGSVMDTCKAANLFATDPEAELLDYVNAPLGRARPITHQLKPLIAVTTTAGTGSETTGTAVFDFLELKAKTGISHRALRPTLGIVDPLHLRSAPSRVTAYTGLDVLCHALESYTALPYQERERAPHPNLRPAYQGNNPISDIWSLHALRLTSAFIKRATYSSGDMEARSTMHLASAYAGIGFGNSGVHLCHAFSYPISGLVRNYQAEGYPEKHPLIPHGLSVIITAPAVFEFTASACPERHLEGAKCLGADVSQVRREDAGKVVAERLRSLMSSLEVPDGLEALGYSRQDLPALVQGALPQHRLTKLCPKPFTEEDLLKILENSLKVY